jgi:LmbE family N-acetylglucosaminyl deacetylase
MRALELVRPGDKLSLLCLGAHSDDIEIGAGGTILELMASKVQLEVHWCVLSAIGERAKEAEASARAFLAGANRADVEIGQFKDGFFPYQGSEIKSWIEDLKSRVNPDVVLTHRREDAHQDHREVCKLTWNAFRDHFILEYEISKWDGDIGQPNIYMPLSAAVLERKIDMMHEHFATQRSKDWFDADTFRGLARLRGTECRAPERYAEGFFLRKARLA